MGQPQFILVTIALSLLAVSTTSLDPFPCPSGQFLRSDTGTCQTCSTCPGKRIVRVPCSDRSDTVCVRFRFPTNFRFQQSVFVLHDDLDGSSSGAGEGGIKATGEGGGGGDRAGDGVDVDGEGNGAKKSGSDDYGYNDFDFYDSSQISDDYDDYDYDDECDSDCDNDKKTGGRDATSAGSEDTTRANRQIFTTVVLSRGDEGTMAVVGRKSGEGGEGQWKGLAFALIVVLSVVTVFLVVFMAMLRYGLSRRSRIPQTSGLDSGDMDAEDVFRRITLVFPERRHPVGTSVSGGQPCETHLARASSRGNLYLTLVADKSKNGVVPGTYCSDFVDLNERQTGHSYANV